MIRIVFQLKTANLLELSSEFRSEWHKSIAEHVLRQEKSDIWLSTELIEQLYVFNKEIINIMIANSVSRMNVLKWFLHIFSQPQSVFPFFHVSFFVSILLIFSSRQNVYAFQKQLYCESSLLLKQWEKRTNNFGAKDHQHRKSHFLS